ncbi:MAG: SRPBCC family protein [Actinomycetota bacterium]
MPDISLHMDAPPERIWRLISDVTRMGDWSPVCYRCEWIGESVGPEVGAKFKGYNRQGPLRWWTTCEVTESEPGRVFEFRTIDGLFSIGHRGREMTRWRYELTPDGIGTNVREHSEVVSLPPLLKLAAPMLRRQEPQREAGMRTTLERLRASAEGEPSSD